MNKKGNELRYHDGFYALYIDGHFIIESKDLDLVLTYFKKDDIISNVKTETI